MSKNKSFMFGMGLLAGVVSGIVAGVLFAPKPGDLKKLLANCMKNIRLLSKKLKNRLLNLSI